MARLDSYGKYPSGLKTYLETYGWHFSPKMCKWAVGKMKKKNPQTGKEEPIETMTKEQIEEFIKKYNVKVEAEGYDLVYIYHYAKADFFKSSIVDEQHLSMFISDYFSDIDGYSEKSFSRFYADCIAMGKPIMWEDML